MENKQFERHDFIDSLNGIEHTFDKSKVKKMLDIQARIQERKSTELEFDQPLVIVSSPRNSTVRK
jgi:hypothetical protein